jgi:hypothetical protein
LPQRPKLWFRWRSLFIHHTVSLLQKQTLFHSRKQNLFHSRNRTRDRKETRGFLGCFIASFWPWCMKIRSSAITWIAARKNQHDRECVGANYAVTKRASNTKIAWCLDHSII